MTASPMESTPTRHERSELTGDQLDALRRLLEADRASLLERAIVSVAEVGQIDSTSATHGRGETKSTVVDIERRVTVCSKPTPTICSRRSDRPSFESRREPTGSARTVRHRFRVNGSSRCLPRASA